MATGSWRQAAQRFRRSESGNIAVLTALTAPVALALAAVAVDYGALTVERRELQGIADLAALAAVQDIGKADEIALSFFRENGINNVEMGSEAIAATSVDVPTLVVIRGRYDANAALAPGQRFQRGEPANAIRIQATRPGQRYFSLVSAPRLGVTATASATPEAAFSIGSRLTRLDGGIVNALLGALTGSTISLSAMDYDALLSADIDLFAMLDALNIGLGLEAGTYAEVLDTNLTLGRFATALARIEGLELGAAASLRRLAAGAGGRGEPFQLASLVDAGAFRSMPPGSRPGMNTSVNAMELVSTAALVSLANGKRQVEIGIGLNLPGLLGARVMLAVGEPPQGSGWLRIGSGGGVVRTAQTRLLVLAEVGGPGGLLGTSVRLPIYLELAQSQARLDSISCPSGRPESVKVGLKVKPGLADLRIADISGNRLSDFSSAAPVAPARLVTAPLVTITGAAHVAIASGSEQPLSFNAADIAAGALKRVSTHGIAGSLTSSLLQDLDLTVNLAGLGIGLPGVLGDTLARTLGAVTPSVDMLLDSVLGTLGISVGEADIRVHGANCGRSLLVQ